MTILKSTSLALAAAASLGFFALTSQPALAGGGHGWKGGHGHHGSHHGWSHGRHFGFYGGYYPGYAYINQCYIKYGPYGPVKVCY